MKTSELKQRYKDALAALNAAQSEFDRIEKEIMRSPVPKQNRQATPRDIREGAFIWYPSHPRGRKLQIVAEVIRPTCDFKAFESCEGDRYGLLGAVVEVEEV